MALCKRAVDLAYKALNEFQKNYLPELDIRSWPEDLRVTDRNLTLDNISYNTLYGYDQINDGWESLVFYTKKRPSKEMQEAFKQLAKSVPNSSFCKPVEEKPGIWKFGWF